MKKNLFLSFMLVASSIFAVAQTAFTAGNIVVTKVGNGSSYTVGQYIPVFFEEYTPFGVLKQTITLPNITIGYGSAAQDMGLSLSSNNQIVSLIATTGTGAEVGSTQSAATVNKVIVSAKPNGTVEYLEIPGASLPKVFRNVIRNDDFNVATNPNGSFYLTGPAEGIRLLNFDANKTATITQVMFPATYNTKGIDIKNGTLYVGAFNLPAPQNNSIYRVGTVGTLPTTTPVAATHVASPGISNTTQIASQGFAFLDLITETPTNVVDVVYYLLNNTIRKYSLVGSSWVNNGDITTFTGVVNTAVTINNAGSGYVQGTTSVTISGGGGSGATADATVSPTGTITGIAITNQGSGYTSTPTIAINGEGTGATATVAIGSLNNISITATKDENGMPALFVTAGSPSSNNSLFLIRDANGHNGAFSATVTKIASSGNYYAFKGVSITPGTTSTTLPVSLTSFTGKRTSNGNQLNWATASEINNQRFDILRSTDKDNFQVISSVNGKNKPSQYNYLDVSPAAGFNYYKLNQVDFDGTVTPSTKIVAINSDLSDKESTITVSNGILTYSINSNAAATSNLQIFDTNGRKVLAKDLSLTTGLTQGTLSVESLNTGVYVARLMVNGKAVTTKFVK